MSTGKRKRSASGSSRKRVKADPSFEAAVQRLAKLSGYGGTVNVAELDEMLTALGDTAEKGVLTWVMSGRLDRRSHTYNVFHQMMMFHGDETAAVTRLLDVAPGAPLVKGQFGSTALHMFVPNILRDPDKVEGGFATLQEVLTRCPEAATVGHQALLDCIRTDILDEEVRERALSLVKHAATVGRQDQPPEEELLLACTSEHLSIRTLSSALNRFPPGDPLLTTPLEAHLNGHNRFLELCCYHGGSARALELYLDKCPSAAKSKGFNGATALMLVIANAALNGLSGVEPVKVLAGSCPAIVTKSCCGPSFGPACSRFILCGTGDVWDYMSHVEDDALRAAIAELLLT